MLRLYANWCRWQDSNLHLPLVWRLRRPVSHLCYEEGRLLAYYRTHRQILVVMAGFEPA